jgi:hypothetical protein
VVDVIVRARVRVNAHAPSTSAGLTIELPGLEDDGYLGTAAMVGVDELPLDATYHDYEISLLEWVDGWDGTNFEAQSHLHDVVNWLVGDDRPMKVSIAGTYDLAGADGIARVSEVTVALVIGEYAPPLPGTTVAVEYDETNGWQPRPDVPYGVVVLWVNRFTDDEPTEAVPGLDISLILGG